MIMNMAKAIEKVPMTGGSLPGLAPVCREYIGRKLKINRMTKGEEQRTGRNEDEAQRLALSEMQRNFDISFKEVTDYDNV